MDLPIDDKELEIVVRQLWKSRKNTGEPEYKKILREEHGMVI